MSTRPSAHWTVIEERIARIHALATQLETEITDMEGGETASPIPLSGLHAAMLVGAARKLLAVNERSYAP